MHSGVILKGVSLWRVQGQRNVNTTVMRASETDKAEVDVDAIVKDLQEKVPPFHVTECNLRFHSTEDINDVAEVICRAVCNKICWCCSGTAWRTRHQWLCMPEGPSCCSGCPPPLCLQSTQCQWCVFPFAVGRGCDCFAVHEYAHVPTYMFLLQLPKLLELVGLGYSAWFVYRYLLFKVSKDL